MRIARMLLCRLGFHKWGKWELYRKIMDVIKKPEIDSEAYYGDTIVQKRECQRCGEIDLLKTEV